MADEQPSLCDLELATYGAISGKLAAGARPREVVLGEHGLDEDAWCAIDDAWQAQFSAAMDACDEGIPPLIAAYAKAFAEAQLGEAAAPRLSLEQYVEAT